MKLATSEIYISKFPDSYHYVTIAYQEKIKKHKFESTQTEINVETCHSNNNHNASNKYTQRLLSSAMQLQQIAPAPRHLDPLYRRKTKTIGEPPRDEPISAPEVWRLTQKANAEPMAKR